MHNDCKKLICRAKQKLLHFGITLLKKKFIHHNVDWKQYFCDVILIEIEIVYSVQSFDSLFNEHDLYTCTLLRM